MVSLSHAAWSFGAEFELPIVNGGGDDDVYCILYIVYCFGL